MIRISEKVYLDKAVHNLDVPTGYLPNPYKETPYLLIQNFFEKEEIKKFVDTIYQEDDAQKAKVKAEVLAGVVRAKVETEYRNTNIYALNRALLKLYNKRFISFQPLIEDYFSLGITLSTEVQALEYKKGGFYIRHADDSTTLIDKEGKVAGFTPVAPERKLTTVLFGTSYEKNPMNRYGFEGGELVFNFLYDQEGEMINLKPTAGDMIVFLSNPYFSHEVKEVKNGYRLTLVQWHNAIF